MEKHRCLQIVALTLSLLLTISISGCESRSTSKSGIATQSFLSDEPCAAPCWYGLVPGESSKADVLRVLAELPFVDMSTISERP
jgi:hypothetical protein